MLKAEKRGLTSKKQRGDKSKVGEKMLKGQNEEDQVWT